MSTFVAQLGGAAWVSSALFQNEDLGVQNGVQNGVRNGLCGRVGSED